MQDKSAVRLQQTFIELNAHTLEAPGRRLVECARSHGTPNSMERFWSALFKRNKQNESLM